MARRDWFTEAFGAAVSDVRSKLIDEAWFGRHTAQTTPTRPAERDPEPSDHDFER